ncbi:TFIIB-type zinc ribbon-containing protein [Stygiolobus caldivivus]|uniref:TFIIB-type domain-containing protein n=1 Tax=Stygiolobus caldivivus TaxID=2824673 RepID=A0A8D5ZG08_9CREN|nr:TFIIB-type zinc ribbon-containing protein [Stygiolobus caldivivus]BCU70588.1 hypothetical protein KN1_18850 [Stygiolobus caldivivus]
MECPYCKNKDLIWDYKNGIIVCSSCGSVIDQIFEQYENAVDEPVNVANYKSVYEPFILKSLSIKNRTDAIVNKNIKRNRLGKLKRSVEEKFIFYNGSVVRESSIIPLKYIENNEKLLIIYDLIERFPQFRDKHIKYKVALTFYFYDKSLFNKVQHNLGISKKYFEKILSKVSTRERILIKNKIEELLFQREITVPTELL